VPKTEKKMTETEKNQAAQKEFNRMYGTSDEESQNKHQEENADKLNETTVDQKIEFNEKQKEVRFKEKTERAKELKEEMQEAENVAKRAKKKTKGKKLF
jgi:hypothetical protein